MSLIGRVLILLHGVSILLMAGAVAMGYGAAAGMVEIPVHLRYGFYTSLGIVFTLVMTIFYFIGIGASMREAAGGHRTYAGHLDAAARLRKHLALPIGLALVTLMAAVILGGGSHTHKLPSWVHHTASLLALVFNVHAAWWSIDSIRANERLIATLEEAISRT